MTPNPFVGSWSYRSLWNNPDLSTELNDLKFGKGTIVIDEAAPELLKGTIGGQGWSLALTGSRSYGNPMEIRFLGQGIVSGEEWKYDYVGYLVPSWQNGVNQVRAMVGSTVRQIPHSEGEGIIIHPAGVVASWYAVWQD